MERKETFSPPPTSQPKGSDTAPYRSGGIDWKKLLPILLLMAAMFCFAAFVHPIPNKTAYGETDLEFWITENVEGVDWSNHDEVLGWFGAREYLGTGYKIGDDGCMRPRYFVSYLLTSYPDHASGRFCVTSITVTDPAVRVYGLTVDSTFEEFDAVFGPAGFKLYDADGAVPIRVAKREN